MSASLIKLIVVENIAVLGRLIYNPGDKTNMIKIFLGRKNSLSAIFWNDR